MDPHMQTQVSNQLLHFQDVSAYLVYESNLSPSEKVKHFRDDYHPEDQAWPEYLDYLEDWEYLYRERLHMTLRDFINVVLIPRQTRIKCGDHTHMFTSNTDLTSTTDKVIIIKRSDEYIDLNSCWYKTLTNNDDTVVAIDPHATAARVSVPESTYIKKATQLNLMLKDMTTHTILSFDDFKQKWWSKESCEVALEIFNQSETPIVSPPNDVITAVKDELKISQPRQNQWLHGGIKHGEETNILPIDMILKDHGLHLLIRSAARPRVLISMINAIRKRAKKHSLIDDLELSQAIVMCELCTKDPTPCPSFPGIYYAPPGNGKTTILNKGLFVGIDTDWLNSESTFSIVMKPFLDNNIPIITNQYDLIPLSGYKLFGIFNHKALRLNEVNQPYTSLTEIVAAQRTYGDDLSISYVNEYLDQYILALQRQHYIYKYSSKQLENPHNKIEFKTVEDKSRSLNQLYSMLNKWNNFSSKQKRAKWSKFKKKHRIFIR